jgi:hypothetical protein
VSTVKVTTKDGSQEDLTASSEESQTKIRNRLKKFFHRRPTKEFLVKKGIYKGNFCCRLMFCLFIKYCHILSATDPEVPGSIPGTTKKTSGSGTGSTQPCECN